METSRSALRRADRLGELVTSLPKWIALAIIVWQGSLSVIALSETGSTAALLTRFGRQASYWEIVCWIAGTLGVFYGLYSRRLLRRQSALVIERLKAIERRLDPDTETTLKSPMVK